LLRQVAAAWNLNPTSEQRCKQKNASSSALPRDCFRQRPRSKTIVGSSNREKDNEKETKQWLVDKDALLWQRLDWRSRSDPRHRRMSMLMIDIVSWLMVGLLTSAIWAHIASADKGNLPRTLSLGMIGAVAGGLAFAAAVSPGKYNIIALISSFLGALVFLFVDELIWAERR
jgi:uncharacterized membrane protein YeaQ/YmgE (transglycosylase-associated protein family)